MDLYIQRFLDHAAVERGLSRSSISSYSCDLAQFAGFLADRGIAGPKDIDSGCLVSFLGYLRQQNFKSTSVARKISAVRSLIKFLVAEKEIVKSPLTALEPSRPPVRLPKSLAVEELSRLLAAPDIHHDLGLRDKAMLETLYATGLRVSELVGLKVEDVNLNSGFVRCVGKGDKERVVPIGEIAANAIILYTDRVRGRFSDDSEYLFLTKLGRPMSRVMFWKIIKKYASVAGISVCADNAPCSTALVCYPSFWNAGRTWQASRKCWATRAFAQRRSTRTFRAIICARSTRRPTRGA